MRSIGIDAVEIHRFTHWHAYTPTTLLKIYTERELAYCYAATTNTDVIAQRFAIRFAAKEATYKALSSAGLLSCSFLSFARTCELVRQHNKAPYITITPPIPDILVLCSLTHTTTTAVAVIVLLNY